MVFKSRSHFSSGKIIQSYGLMTRISHKCCVSTAAVYELPKTLKPLLNGYASPLDHLVFQLHYSYSLPDSPTIMLSGPHLSVIIYSLLLFVDSIFCQILHLAQSNILVLPLNVLDRTLDSP